MPNNRSAYVFDTNVLSEVMKERPDAAVVDWLRHCPAEAMLTTSISQAEILFGVRRLPEGARRARLLAAAVALFTTTLAGRILAFDEQAASIYADIRIAGERAGRPVAEQDGMIAAITRAHNVRVLTRDERGFADCGVAVVNPWKSTETLGG
ncbi:MAG TPA: type II toxin-antitoxin system VapC family toxin [Geminicoccaceae bacterium]|nr:type II toxin-antitoxin system VapC family toxin [Geminicoccaceae bacterium]HRY24483.1 type II toxin-antitoxin system VapC family toxin [Geminicoccaceae bacterium]